MEVGLNTSRVAVPATEVGVGRWSRIEMKLPETGHSGAVVTHSAPTSDVGGSNPGRYVGKLAVAYRWSTA